VLGIALEQRLHGHARIGAAVDDGGDLLDDGHVHALLDSERLGGAGGAHALDGLPDLGHGGVGVGTAGERQAEPAVARLVIGAGEHQVAHTSQAREGLAVTAKRRAQARQLGEAARDHGGARVGAEAQAVGDAAGDRVDVLERARDDHTGDIRIGVGAQAGAVEPANGARGEVRVGRGDRHGGRQATRDLAGEAGPR